MIVVDTSVWIEVTRRRQSPNAAIFQQLLDADEIALALPVRLELMAGVAGSHRAAFRRALSALPILRPADDTWRLIETWVDGSAEKGFRFSIPDLLVAALAHEFDALVWSLDDDFEVMEKLRLVRLYR